jgi:predicted aspartyl protease
MKLMYIGDAPFMPLRIQGKKESIKELALVDTGARYVTIRSDLGDVLELKEIGRKSYLVLAQRKNLR